MRDHHASAPASDDPGKFLGLQRTTAEFDEQEETEFGDIWRRLAMSVQWLER
jgi:hypothetical protein